ncbi:hypothetical protein HMPREF9154_0599 [Arachnia propionica F0230a]|nr:hypothetical protein HMPREF9154_0599 [Arachnia propionica F0230a]
MGHSVFSAVSARSPARQPSRLNRFLDLKGVDPGNGLVVSSS